MSQRKERTKKEPSFKARAVAALNLGAVSLRMLLETTLPYFKERALGSGL